MNDYNMYVEEDDLTHLSFEIFKCSMWLKAYFAVEATWQAAPCIHGMDTAIEQVLDDASQQRGPFEGYVHPPAFCSSMHK